MTADRAYNIFSRRYWLGQIDLRPLGFMRVVFGGVLFWSVLDLAPVLFDFFSDAGVAPRSALLGSLVRANRFSIYDLAGPPWVLVSLYVVTLLSILLFAVGWHSRAATVATFVLVCGLHERNLLVFDGSDNVLRVLLFWMMFMPVGARYSLDSVLRNARRAAPVTHGTALPIRMGQIQIAWVYLNTILYKWPGVEWHNGTALRIGLGLDHLFVRTLGHWMFNNRPFIALGTHFTIVTELAFLPLAFLPLWQPRRGPLARWPRWLFQPTWKAVGLAGITALHLGIAVLMRVGNFSYIMISSLFLFYEPSWIEGILAGLRRLWSTGSLEVFYDGDCAVCQRVVAALRGFDIFGNLELVNFRQQRAMAGGLPRGMALEDRIHSMSKDGKVRAGWPAWLEIARRIPAFAPLWVIGSAPGVAAVASPIYERIAVHRQSLVASTIRGDRGGSRFSPVLQPVVGAATAALYVALPLLMAACMWFAFPPDAVLPGLKIGSRQIFPTVDVAPSKMWRPLHDAIEELELWQKWDMFSPKPLDHDVYITGNGELTDGTSVDVLRGDRGDGTGPLLPPTTPGFFFTRWTKYVNNLVYEGDNSPWSLEFGRYVCRRWNNQPPARRASLKSFRLYRQEHRTPNFGETDEPWHEQMIWDHRCF